MSDPETNVRLRARALAYHQAGLSVLPARLPEKFPAVRRWKPYQKRLPTGQEVEAWFSNHHEALCLVTGPASGNLEALDFDMAGEFFERWRELVRAAAPGLVEKLVIEKSPSGGFHVAYRCEAAVSGNLKLAQRKQYVASSEPVIICGKELRPRREKDGRWSVIVTLIETRGEGGLFLCAPSPGYELVQGDFTTLPTLSTAERETLLEAAWSLNEHVPEPENVPAGAVKGSDARPGDEFNERGDVREILTKHGWTLAKPGENEYWRRPGKSDSWSATLKNRVFYVFSSNAALFEPNHAYSPFAVYAHLEHNGDFAKAAAALRAAGYGKSHSEDSSPDVDLSRLLSKFDQAPAPEIPDPGPLPVELLRAPGFISEVMDYCLETAPYPNIAMAFCGALSLQAFLAGRRVRDPGDNRTNIYLLGLAYSAAGKDWPRKVNTRIVHSIGLSGWLGDRFASGEGIQDALFLTPCMLFQTDEIDGMLQSINKAKDARHENVMGTLLTLYSAANSVFPMRRKAGKEAPGVIDQPCLVLFGTAIPNHYYEALSERMLTNGFFARMIIVESGPRPKGQEPHIRNIPARILETARWWSQFRSGGNLDNWHPNPVVVEYAPEAQPILIEAREEADAEYAKAEQRNDSVGTTVWGRVNEQIRKLSLICAISENHERPQISLAAVQWARALVTHQTRRMLFMARNHVADNPFHALSLKALEKLREAPNQTLPHSILLKRMKIDALTFQNIIETLSQQGDVECVPSRTSGRTGTLYRMRADA